MTARFGTRTLLTHSSMCSSFLYLWSEVPAFTVCIENAATAAEKIDNFIVKNATEEGVNEQIHLIYYLNEFASRCGCETLKWT